MNEEQAREIFGLPSYANRKQGYNRYRYLLKKYHPDKGGSTNQCQAVIAAWDMLKDVLPRDLPIVTLMEIDYKHGVRVWWRMATHEIDKNGDVSRNYFPHIYTRTRSNVYEWCDVNAEFYPNFREEDKILHDGKNCKIVMLSKNTRMPEWAKWKVPWK